MSEMFKSHAVHGGEHLASVLQRLCVYTTSLFPQAALDTVTPMQGDEILK